MKILADVNVHTDRVELSLLHKLVEKLVDEVTHLRYEVKIMNCEVKEGLKLQAEVSKDVKHVRVEINQTKETIMGAVQDEFALLKTAVADLKTTAEAEKTEVTTAITALEKKIQDLIDAGDAITVEDLASLKTEVGSIKESIQGIHTEPVVDEPTV